MPTVQQSLEVLTITCASNDTRQVVVSGTGVFVVTRQSMSGSVLTLKPVHDYNNSEVDYAPFSVSCELTLVMSDLGDSGAVYVDASVRQIVGRVRNVWMPLFQDVWVLDSFGNWTSSLTADGWFALSVSQNVTAIAVGDMMYRGNGGPHFLPGDVFVTVGSQRAVVLGVFSDVRDAVGGNDGAAPLWGGNDGTPADGVMFVFPSYNASCWDVVRRVDTCTSAESSYKSIGIGNGEGSVVGGGVISCPPLCPGKSSSASAGGVMYSSECTGGYLHGAGCLSVENASRCAYGNGDHCRRCPTGAICPGGFLMWCVRACGCAVVLECAVYWLFLQWLPLCL